jgi:undecaprenyl pyrophosphate phosphatase UppP
LAKDFRLSGAKNATVTGWTPATWQGWLIILVYFIVFGILAYIFQTNIKKYSVFYFIAVFVITGLLIYISYKKGEPAKWRWGKK